MFKIGLIEQNTLRYVPIKFIILEQNFLTTIFLNIRKFYKINIWLTTVIHILYSLIFNYYIKIFFCF